MSNKTDSASIKITINNIYNVILFSIGTTLSYRKPSVFVTAQVTLVAQRCNGLIVGIMLPLLRSVLSAS